MVGVALTGCMKNEVYVPKCETPISFEVANYVAQTRAGAFDYNEFGVDAWSYDATAGTVKIMENEVVSYDDVNDQWAPSKTYYWPINGTVDFIAYYPKTSKPTISYKYDGTDTITYTDYTVGEEDLMYADKAIRYSQNVSAYGFTGVPTVFRHALAKVNFNVQNAYPAETNNDAITYEIVVDKITLNTHPTGLVTLTNAGTTAASLGTWSVDDNVWDPTSDLTALEWTSNVNLADDSVVAYATRTQYVLPQILDNNVTVEVVYTVSQYQKIGSTKTLISKKQYTPEAIKLNTMGLPSWQMNKNITYTISIIAKSNQILFAPAVEDWATATGETTIL